MYLGFRKPDLAFYLCADLDLVKQRNKDRDDSRTALFKDSEKMSELDDNLSYIADKFLLIKINVNNKSVKELKDEIFKIVKPYVNRV